MATFKTKPPERVKPNPYVPTGPLENLIFEQFEGINTSTSRPGVDDRQAFWIDGFMPIGPRFLRTLYGIGDSIYESADISFFDFVNIGSTPYMIVVNGDGSMDAVNTSTSAMTAIAPAGTIQDPSRDSVGLRQFGNTYAIITADQTNGYFLWDGTTLFTAGGLSPEVEVTAGGTGFVTAPGVVASGGTGTGATFVATIANGVVTDITVTNPGTGYLAGESVTIAISGGGGSGATGTVTLMPFAISGTTVETYSGRVWVANGPSVSFGAPGSVSDFSTASGGGNFQSSDSFLRVEYTQLIQSNGFLYLVADSSVNYISGVQTSGSPPTTTFTNQNADPEVGTPWPTTVDTFGRAVIFANAFGVHINYGAAVTKISDALDGVYNTVSNFSGFIPSAAKAIIFGKRVWMLLLPIIDPISGQQVNKIFMWDSKRWWATSQDVALTYIQHQEINSVITAYGTDGTSIYPLFNQPSSAFTKIAQSKLWDRPGGYQIEKGASRLWMLAQYYSLEFPNIDVSIDNEINSAQNAIAAGPLELEWTNNVGAEMTWTNNVGDAMIWYSSGTGIVSLGPYSVGQNGALLGMTIETRSPDMALVSAMIHPEIVGYRG